MENETNNKKPLKKIVAENLTDLRKKKGLTQIQLAELFNYSDKAVSKWECGDTTPDLETLKALADFYGVTIDYLTIPVGEDKKDTIKKEEKKEKVNKPIICLLSSLIPVLVAIIVFIILIVFKLSSYPWMAFIWSLPVISILLFIFSWIWYDKITRSICGIIMTWLTIATIYIQLGLSINNGFAYWELFLIGIPVTIALLLWCIVKKKVKEEKKN